MKNRYFRKKPVIIEAYQTSKELIIKTLEGDMIASKGDWIVMVNNIQLNQIFLKKRMNL